MINAVDKGMAEIFRLMSSEPTTYEENCSMTFFYIGRILLYRSAFK